MGDSLPNLFQIESVAVPLLWQNYFTSPQARYQTISTETLLDRIVATGANDVRLIGSLGILDNVRSSTYAPFTTQSIDSLRTFTDAAHQRGLAITWTPQSHFQNLIPGDPTQLSHLSPSDANAWFANFKVAVLDNARIAQAIGAERFSLLTDVEQFVFHDHPELTDRMVALVDEIRQVYSGKITSILTTTDAQLYSFPDAILRKLDIIGLGLFPKLTNNTNPTLGELKGAWHGEGTGIDLIASLGRMAATYGKQIWLSDFAQSSYDGWLRGSPQKFDPNATFVPDNSEQTLGYQAALSELLKSANTWFAGLSAQNISRIENDNGLLPKFLQSTAGENFYGKPALDVLTSYFTGSAAFETINIRGGNYGETLQGGYGFNSIIAGQASQTIAGGPLDDVIVSQGGSTGVPAHELKLTVSGNATGGTAPTFEIWINGKVLPITFTATASASQPGGAVITLPVFETAQITSFKIVTTNWFFGGGENRYIRFSNITLDGANIKALPSVYVPQTGGTGTFTGDTNRGGIVTYDTTSLTLTPALRINLAANHTIDGGAGRDTLAYDGASGQYLLTNVGSSLWTVQKPGAAVGEGRDTISGVEVLRFADKSLWIGDSFNFSDQTGALRLDLRAGAASNAPVGGQTVAISAAVDVRNANGGTGADVITGNALGNSIFGGAGNDSIDGGSGINYLRGDEGNDSLIGGNDFDDINGNMGNDTVSTGAGEDYCVGGRDNDSLSGGANYDLVYGNLGDDTCNGDDGDDIVRGGQGNDLVNGGAGNDFVSGDKGDDTLSGGAGADTFNTFGDAGIDRVIDFNLAEGDRVQLAPGTIFTLSQVGADTVINMTGGGQMTLVGVQLSSLTGNWIFGA